jgi:hypothetical protein
MVNKPLIWAERFESRAKELALAGLELAPRQRGLNVGVGTGHQQAQLQTSVTPGGLGVGLGISRSCARSRVLGRGQDFGNGLGNQRQIRLVF